jgi:hemerythrin-like domain-containing protein
MQARAPLMIEHRLIERMIGQIEKALTRIKEEKKVDPVFIDTAVDFIRTYADRTHHGKEEDILFRDLGKKRLSADDERVMNELIAEHVIARNTTRALVEANDRYRHGDQSALTVLAEKLSALVALYPKHIDKEDKLFFPSCRAYMSEEEEQRMLDAFWEFDREMIHEKYRTIVEGLETD